MPHIALRNGNDSCEQIAMSQNGSNTDLKATGAAPVNISVTIYIDQSLLQPDGSGNIPLANLAIARMVGGTSNVIFQSLTTENFTTKNGFAWTTAYGIGASKVLPTGGTQVSASTGPVPIQTGYACDWQPGQYTLQYMPPATPNTNMVNGFGTANEPAAWYNSIWCQLGSAWIPIYQDKQTYPGLKYRSYSVENNYTLSWASSSVVPGLIVDAWSSPWTFSMGPNDTTKFLSWGPVTPGSTSVQWFEYATDPTTHDPSVATGGSGPMLALGAFLSPQRPVSFALEWRGSLFGEKVQSNDADAVWGFLLAAAKDYLNVVNVDRSDGIRATVALKQQTAFAKVLLGSSDDEKILVFIRGILALVAPDYAPTLIHFGEYRALDATTSSPDLGGVFEIATFLWSNLETVKQAGVVVSNFLSYIKSMVTGKDKSISVSSIQTNTDGSLSASITATNYSPSDLATTLTAIKVFVTKEQKAGDPITYEVTSQALSSLSKAGMLEYNA